MYLREPKIGDKVAILPIEIIKQNFKSCAYSKLEDSAYDKLSKQVFIVCGIDPSNDPDSKMLDVVNLLGTRYRLLYPQEVSIEDSYVVELL